MSKRGIPRRNGENADMSEESKLLRLQFESAAELARQDGRPEAGSCFAALAASVDSVPSELLDAYFEMFQGIEDAKIGVSLMGSIRRGWWSPGSATEYTQRFIAFASGTEAFRYG